MRRPSLRNLSLLVWVGVASSCAHHPPTPSKQAAPRTEKPAITIIVDHGLTAEADVETAVAIWTAYGLALAASYNADQGEPLIQDRYPGVRIEYGGRLMMALNTRSRLKEGEPTLPYAQSQADLFEANLLLEYVLASFSMPGWYVRARDVAEVDFERYESWMAEHLPEHEPQKRAWIAWESDRPVHYPGPGRWTRESISLSDSNCAAKVDGLLDSAARWKEESAALDAVLVSAQDRTDFIKTLRFLRGSDAAKSKGVLWVDPGVAVMHYVAGYCAIDEETFEAALDPLRTAIALDPLNPSYYSDLAGALVHTGRHTEALQVVEAGLQVTDNSCEVATLLRRRGWAYLESGQLPLARVAYLQSLELDATTEAARHQLGTIDDLARESGRSLESANPPPYTPPPSAPPMKILSCKDREP